MCGCQKLIEFLGQKVFLRRGATNWAYVTVIGLVIHKNSGFPEYSVGGFPSGLWYGTWLGRYNLINIVHGMGFILERFLIDSYECLTLVLHEILWDLPNR